jgi:hypothetical protein
MMTPAQRRLQKLRDQLEQIDTLTASGAVTYTPELDSAMAQLREEIEDLSDRIPTSEASS